MSELVERLADLTAHRDRDVLASAWSTSVELDEGQPVGDVELF